MIYLLSFQHFHLHLNHLYQIKRRWSWRIRYSSVTCPSLLENKILSNSLVQSESSRSVSKLDGLLVGRYSKTISREIWMCSHLSSFLTQEFVTFLKSFIVDYYYYYARAYIAQNPRYYNLYQGNAMFCW